MSGLTLKITTLIADMFMDLGNMLPLFLIADTAFVTTGYQGPFLTGGSVEGWRLYHHLRWLKTSKAQRQYLLGSAISTTMHTYHPFYAVPSIPATW